MTFHFSKDAANLVPCVSGSCLAPPVCASTKAQLDNVGRRSSGDFDAFTFRPNAHVTRLVTGLCEGAFGIW